MGLAHLTGKVQTMIEHADKTVIVFIDGPFTTPADLELAAEVGRHTFRNAQENALPPEPCRGAVAVKPELIPEGYHILTDDELEEIAAEDVDVEAAPSTNPGAQPWKPGTQPAGPIVSDEE